LVIENRRKIVWSVIGALGNNVLNAEGFVIDRLAVLLDEQDSARDFAGRNFRCGELTNRIKLLAG